MRKNLFTLVIILGIIAASGALEPLLKQGLALIVPDESESAQIERVVDGDTIVLEGGEKVRLIGIDTPESVPPRPKECWGDQAKTALIKLLPVGSPVKIYRHGQDSYGRTLGRIEREDGLMVQVWMVQEGHAAPYHYQGQRDRWADDVDAAQKTAQTQRVGMWGACQVVYEPTQGIQTGPVK